MKLYISLLLLFAMTLSLVACTLSGNPADTTGPAVTTQGGSVTSGEGSESVSTTRTPETTKVPDTTKAPETTKAPDTTKAPETTKAPDTTKAPETTKAPVTTKAPETTKAPVTTKAPETTKEPEPEADVIYYENFESLSTSLSSDTLIKELGWLLGSKDNGAYNNSTVSYEIVEHNGSKVLKLMNKSSSAVDSYVTILSEAQMGIYHESDYTYQYDLIYTDASDGEGYIAVVSDYNGKKYNMFALKNSGYGVNQCHYTTAWLAYDRPGLLYSSNKDNNSIVTRLLGKSYVADTQAFSNISVSVRYVVDWKNGNSVYIRLNTAGYEATGKWVLVSKFDSTAGGAPFFDKEKLGGGIAIKVSANQNGYIDNIKIWKGTSGEPSNEKKALVTSKSTGCSGHNFKGDDTCISPLTCIYCQSLKNGVPSHKYVTVGRGGDKACSVCNLFVDTNGVTFQAGDKLPLTEGADVRIMSFNILSEEWDSTSTLAARVNGVVAIIRAYGPDVIGVQEVSQKWYAQLKNLLGDEYVFINSDILGNKNYNYSALAYRKDSVKLIESDLMFYSVYNSQRIRLINFGLFERLSDGKKFGVTCTHYNANHNNRDHTPERKVQATEFVAKIKEYYSKYNCPIFSTGDYNCNETTEPYKIMMDSGILKSSKYEALEKGRASSTTHSLGNMPSSGLASIDHIFYAGSATPLYYTTIVDSVAIAVSDHTPIYCDFKLN